MSRIRSNSAGVGMIRLFMSSNFGLWPRKNNFSSIGLAVIVTMNIILFCRILTVDFSDIFKRGEGKDKKEEVKMTNGSSKPVIRSTAYVDALFQEETTKLSLD